MTNYTVFSNITLQISIDVRETSHDQALQAALDKLNDLSIKEAELKITTFNDEMVDLDVHDFYVTDYEVLKEDEAI